MVKLVITANITTQLNFLILAIEYSLSNVLIILALVGVNLAIMLYYLTSCKIDFFSIRLLFFALFQIIDGVIFFKYDLCNKMFILINTDYGKPNAGTGFGIIILVPVYLLCIIASILISIIVQIAKKYSNERMCGKGEKPE